MADNTNKNDDVRTGYLSSTLDDQPDDASVVDETDLEKIADQVVGEADSMEDEDELSLNSYHEDGDEIEENGDADNIVAAGIDEGAE